MWALIFIDLTMKTETRFIKEELASPGHLPQALSTSQNSQFQGFSRVLCIARASSGYRESSPVSKSYIRCTECC